MRMPGETATSNVDQADQVGLDYFNVPVDKAALSAHSINELEQVMRGTEGPTLLHCGTGARAALMLALSRSRKNGWNAERTFEEARRMGFDIQHSGNFASFVKQITGEH